MATSFSARSDAARSRELAREVAGRIDGGASVPLLALRIPAFEAIAWRDGRSAARTVERRALAGLQAAGVLRAGDALAHRSGSDRFAIALLAPARSGRRPQAPEVRLALGRIAGAAARTTGLRVQSGWCTLERRDDLESLGAAIDTALERGLRERERGELLATLGHELRTPLHAIGGYLETLQDGGLDAAAGRRFLQTAHREVQRLGRMADGLLAISLLDLAAPQNQACCDVAEVVEHCVEALAPLARRRRVDVRVRTAGDCGACIDADRCAQAVSNLLHNALQWATATVRVESARFGDAVAIAFDDDGPGISPPERERVFALGVRGSQAAKGGAGIGLAIVRAVARRFGGDAFAAASPLGGARLLLRLPAAST